MTRYIALIDGRKGAYGVVFPDLPGCTSQGITIDDAMTNAVEAVRLWVEEIESQGGEAPRPRDLDAVKNDAEVREALSDGAAIAVVPSPPRRTIQS